MPDDSTHTAPLDDPSDASTSAPRGAGFTASFAGDDDPGPPPAPPPGYELREPVGRGGMGVIYRARDVALNRDVAVKFLRARYPADGTEARRFVQEAQIAAQLTHPGVPPVHEVGTLADGRPYIVMKLVEGLTLQKHLRHEPGGRLLGAFEQVCQTVGYAHANGVVHRDLKPANIMVGKFGEVQVMDWGLARRTRGAERGAPNEGEGGLPSPIPHSALRTPQSAETATGSVLGTPAYMSPEQAAGEVSKLDARTDVFGLGAVLCAALTGQPPYAADDDIAVSLMAIRGDLRGATARLGACGAAPDVVALCLRCLAPDRAERPADANEVAAAVAAIRAAAEERARAAELDRVRLDGQLREQRQKRRVRLTVGGLCALFLVGAGALAWWADRHNARRDADLREAALREQLADERLAAERRERLARAAGTVAALLDECEANIRDGNLPTAGVVLAQAAALTAEGLPDPLAGRLGRCRADLDLLRELDRLDQRWPVGTGRPTIGKRRTEEIPAALARYGIVPGVTPPADAAARVRGSLVRDHILTALDQWLEWQPAAAVADLLKAADPDPFRDAVRAAQVAGDGHAVDVLAASPAALDQPARYAAVLGDTLVVPPPRRRRLLLAALERTPGDFRLLMTLGYLWMVESPGAADRYEKWYRAAVAVRPTSPIAHNYLGTSLMGTDRDGAIRAFREAVRLEPRYPGALNNLGSILIDAGDLLAAAEAFERAVGVEPGYPLAFGNLGRTRELLCDWPGAARAYADWVRARPDDASVHNRVAWFFATAPNAAVRDGRRAVELATRACALSGHKDGNHVDTLAAAWAATGEFAKAAEEQKRALTFPEFERRHGPAARERLKLYERGQPYHEPPTLPLAPPPRPRPI